MKIKLQIPVLLFIFCLTTALQCNKDECKSGEFRLDTSKSWLPLKGKTQLSFLDGAGNPVNFNINVVDTVKTNVNPDCGATTIYEEITVIISLNPPNRDVIVFSLNPPNFLVVTGSSGTDPLFYMRDVFKKANEGNVVKRLNNYFIGSRSYNEVILMTRSTPVANSIDSVFMANNAGIVGFNYNGVKYSLQ
jgi:hypothetical protein